jgi:hypothetical protein
VGAPAYVGKRKKGREMEEKNLETGIVITSGSTGTSTVSHSGRAPLRREQLEYSRRRTDQATRRRHKLETLGMNWCQKWD